MWLYPILLVLMMLFVSSSILFAMVIWFGRGFPAEMSERERTIAKAAGFHARESIEKYVGERYRRFALVLFFIRNWSLGLVIFLSVFEYLLRSAWRVA